MATEASQGRRIFLVLSLSLSSDTLFQAVPTVPTVPSILMNHGRHRADIDGRENMMVDIKWRIEIAKLVEKKRTVR